MGDEAALPVILSWASIACGFHSEDPMIVLATCARRRPEESLSARMIPISTAVTSAEPTADANYQIEALQRPSGSSAPAATKAAERSRSIPAKDSCRNAPIPPAPSKRPA
ncbi:hypothetical protein [Paracoccus ravus]|uniref:hypothetical protein n=1 Tax=Paracoccus ravus TaxID=2447760 RepID=UPI001FD647A3|nr:hypothetical protein [Paracoccus ravus]